MSSTRRPHLLAPILLAAALTSAACDADGDASGPYEAHAFVVHGPGCGLDADGYCLDGCVPVSALAEAPCEATHRFLGCVPSGSSSPRVSVEELGSDARVCADLRPDGCGYCVSGPVASAFLPAYQADTCAPCVDAPALEGCGVCASGR